MSLTIIQPFPQFFDLNGTPLDNGYVYIGVAGDNPETAPLATYWDEALTQLAQQPLRTVNGYIARNGTPSAAFIGADSFACLTKNSARSSVLYSPSVAAASLASVAQAGTSAAEAAASAAAAAASAAAAATTAASVLTEAQLNVALGKMRVPIGAIIPMGMGTPPFGYLECDGAAVSRTTYSVLFAAIGTTYGVGDGSTTFNVPETRGRFVRGWDHGAAIDVGRVLGSLQADAQQNITGSFSIARQPSATGVFSSVVDGSGRDSASSGARVTLDASTQIRTAPEVRPVNVSAMYCIKAFDDVAAGAVIPGVTEAVIEIFSVAGVLTIDLSQGTHFKHTLTENITSIVVTNGPSAGFGYTFFLWIKQHATSAKTVAFPALFRPANGVSLSISSTLGRLYALSGTTGFDSKYDVTLSERAT